MAYDQRSQGGEASSYGITDLPENVVFPADKFLHAQSSYFGAVSCQICCGIIFGGIMAGLWKSKNMSVLFTEVVGVTPSATTEMGQFFLFAQNGWWAYLILWVVWCCVGAAILAIAANCVKNQSTGGLCFCSILEGISACCACSSCVGLFWKIIAIFMLASVYGSQVGKETVCNTLLSMNPANVTPVTLGATQVIGATQVMPQYGNIQTHPQYGNCLLLVDGLRSIYIVAGVYTIILLCCQCSILGACASGAKYAHETKEAIEDSESGMMQNYY